MRAHLSAAMLIALATTTAGASQKLKVGDPAPPFSVTEWLKGAPEDLASGRGKKIYVLDFWATWCMPCIQGIPSLAALQAKYRDKGLVLIGVTGPAKGQQLSVVKRFLSSRGEAMGYTVAWDQTGAMWRNYLDAAGAMGIPHAFIIDKQGRIAWQGHPATIERVLDEIVSGTFDAAREARRAAKEAQIMELLPRYGMEARAGSWEAALAILNDVIKLDPTHQTALAEAYYLQHRQLKDIARARAWAERFIAAHSDDPDALLAMAEMLLTVPLQTERMPDVMFRAALAAYDLTKGKDVNALRIYARAAHRVGHLDEAIRLQAQAVDLASAAMKPTLTTSLEYYQACKQLRDSHFSPG